MPLLRLRVTGGQPKNTTTEDSTRSLPFDCVIKGMVVLRTLRLLHPVEHILPRRRRPFVQHLILSWCIIAFSQIIMVLQNFQLPDASLADGVSIHALFTLGKNYTIRQISPRCPAVLWNGNRHDKHRRDHISAPTTSIYFNW
jgi:hypothetical protein